MSKGGWPFIKASLAFGQGQIAYVKATAKTLDKVAHRILTEAKKRAPVDTGALRASGRVLRVNQHQRIVQFGGGGTGVDYAQAVELGTHRQRPQPFLEPAVIAQRKSVKRIFQQDGNRVLRVIARSGSTK